MSTAYAKRFEAVLLCTHAKGPKSSYAVAAKVMKRSKKFVVKWVTQYKSLKHVDDLPNREKTRALTSKQEKTILQLFESNLTLRLREAKVKLARKEIKVSINTIRQRLHKAKVLYRSTSSKPLLLEAHMQKRMSWAIENINRGWSNVIFSDEATF